MEFHAPAETRSAFQSDAPDSSAAREAAGGPAVTFSFQGGDRSPHFDRPHILNSAFDGRQDERRVNSFAHNEKPDFVLIVIGRPDAAGREHDVSDPAPAGWGVHEAPEPFEPQGNTTNSSDVSGKGIQGSGVSKNRFAGGEDDVDVPVPRPPTFAPAFLVVAPVATPAHAAAPAEVRSAAPPAADQPARRAPPRDGARQSRRASNNSATAPPPESAAERQAAADRAATAAEPAPHEPAPPVEPQSAAQAPVPSRSVFDRATVARVVTVVVGIARAVEVASIGPLIGERVETAVAKAADAVTLAETVGETAAEAAAGATSGLLNLPTGPVMLLGLAPGSARGAVASWWPTERTWRVSAALGLLASLAGYGYCRADAERRRVVATRIAPVVRGRRPDHGL
jgi:hypothetical protein